MRNRYGFQHVLHLGQTRFSLREERVTAFTDRSYSYTQDPDPKLAMGRTEDLALATLSKYRSRKFRLFYGVRECPCIVFGSATSGKWLGLGHTTKAEQDWIVQEVNAAIINAKKTNNPLDGINVGRHR